MSKNITSNRRLSIQKLGDKFVNELISLLIICDNMNILGF